VAPTATTHSSGRLVPPEHLADHGFEPCRERRRVGVHAGAVALQLLEVARDRLRAFRVQQHFRNGVRLAEQGITDRRWRDYTESRQGANSLEDRPVTTEKGLETGLLLRHCHICMSRT
jgi:hypothetical protein